MTKASTAKPSKAEQAKAEAKAKAAKEDAELLALTADAETGKADRVDGEERTGMVAFTFDDGPNPETTPAVIDALERYDVPATFFVVTRRLLGNLGEKPRSILARMLESGFLVASHSVSHPDLRGSKPKRLAAEIDQSIRTLAKEAGRPIGMFRPPFGAIDAKGRAWLARRGLTEVRWSIDTLDWQAKSAEKLRAKTMKMILAKNGGVVLMHDVKQVTAAAIGPILDDLEAENCRRLAANEQPIIPVSIHYFLRDAKKPRAIPKAVENRTAAYRLMLPVRCFWRWDPPAS